MKTLTRQEFTSQQAHGNAGTATALLPSTIARWSKLPGWRGHWAMRNESGATVLEPVRIAG